VGAVAVVVNAPLGGPQAAGAEQRADGVGGGDLGVPGVEHHAHVLGDRRGQRAVLHLSPRQQQQQQQHIAHRETETGVGWLQGW